MFAELQGGQCSRSCMSKREKGRKLFCGLEGGDMLETCSPLHTILIYIMLNEIKSHYKVTNTITS